ncbi:MAG: glycine cleavage system protein GcvH [Bacteroidota bacterium]|jgi:glycine cleavage system H protein
MSYPADLRYTHEHEWIRVEGDIATVGITHHAQESLGDIVYLEVSGSGLIAQNEVFGVVEAVKAASDLFMPVSGEIIEINSNLETDPSLVNSDPYGEGWMIRVKLANPDEVAGLLSSETYENAIA